MSKSTQDFINEVKGCLEYHDKSSTSLKLDSLRYFCYKNTRLDELSKVDISTAVDLTGLFQDCTSLISGPDIDTSACKIFVRMFHTCSSLSDIPRYDFSNLTQAAYMFQDCTSLVSVPSLNLSKATWLAGMFRGCTSLISVDSLDTTSVKELNEMFYGCTSLTTISGLDLSKATNTGWMFINCSALTDLYLYNIAANLTIGSGTSWGHLLTVDSIVNTIKELVTVNSAKTLSMGSTNLAKIADLYCKITDDTNAKLTMELCESTDEGAMLLSEYAALKNWQFA